MTRRRTGRIADPESYEPAAVRAVVIDAARGLSLEPGATAAFDVPSRSLYGDVGAFHERFRLPCETDGPPAPLSHDVLLYRIKFILEELAEFALSQGAAGLAEDIRDLMASADRHVVMESPSMAGLADGADALVDLAYVVLGTAQLMRLPFDACWAEVQRANMEKERGPTEKRGHELDVRKPEGWRGPEHWPILFAAAVGAKTS